MGNIKIKYFAIENRIEELTSLAEQIDKLAEEWAISLALAMNINLVIEEAISNIIFYAFTDSNKHKIRISVSLANNSLTIKITDDGIPFNPLEHKQPDINLPVGERPVGGLGIFLISQIMDERSYIREGNKNILTLIKSI
jgi:serine/threonine-protein kinase RsbW